MKKGIAYIYGIRPKNGEYFYIGSTVKPIKSRLRQHILQHRRGEHSQQFSSFVNRFGSENIEIDTIETVAMSERDEREYYWINFYLQDCAGLANRIRSIEQSEGFKRSLIRRVGEETFLTLDLISKLVLDQFLSRRPLWVGHLRYVALVEQSRDRELGDYVAEVHRLIRFITNIFLKNTSGIQVFCPKSGFKIINLEVG